MKISYTKVFFLVIVFSLFIGCAAQTQLSPLQKRERTTRLIEGEYEIIFKSALVVIQDQSYIIKTTDMNTGLVNAVLTKEAATGDQVLQALFLGYVYDKGSDLDLSIMCNKINDISTEVRINILESKYGQSSAWSGSSRQSAKQIYNPEVYNKLFNDIITEVKRREAMGN